MRLVNYFNFLMCNYKEVNRENPSIAVYRINTPEEFCTKLDEHVLVKNYAISYERITWQAKIGFPLDIMYAYETRYVNVNGTYSVREILHYEEKKHVEHFVWV
jgi:hypothetical protein